MIEKALSYWGKAGQQAFDRSAMVEAASHLNRALKVPPALPDTPARCRCELNLQSVLARALRVAKGGDPDVEHAYLRARALAEVCDDKTQLLIASRGLCSVYLNCAQPEAALEVGKELLRLAQQWEDDVAVSFAHEVLGIGLYHIGNLALARAHLEQALSSYDPARQDAWDLVFSPRVLRLFVLAWIVMHRGFPDQALAHCREALSEARHLSPCHPRLCTTRNVLCTGIPPYPAERTSS